MTISPKPRKPKRWELYKREFQIPELRTDEPVGLYPRQSTKKQQKRNRQSFEKQTIDNVEDLIKRGWTRELIRIYDQDNGRSAARALEDKEALSQMLADIREKRIRTVRAGEVDRLFRDEDRIDSNLFIKYCKEADCLVLTSLEIFQWLYDCGGVLGVLYERLAQMPYVFPLEEEWVREQKAFWTNLEEVYGTQLDEEGNLKPIGYRISAHGLTYMLGNRVYRGDWPHDGEWIEGNHDAIIPQDLFDFAREVLERNRKELAEVANYHTYTTSGIHDILYPGPEGVKKRSLVRHRQYKKGHEQYQIKEQHGLKYATLATIDTQDVERVFFEKFTERLRDTKRFEDYEERLVKDEENEKVEDRRKNLQDTITQLTERIDGLFLTLQSSKLKPEERDEYIEERHRLIKRREADTFYWSEEEDNILNELYPTEPPETLLQALPNRTWKGIMSRASELRIRRLKKTGGVLYPQMSVEDLQIIEKYAIPMANLGGTLFVQWICPSRA